jgi:hypothetical protein
MRRGEFAAQLIIIELTLLKAGGQLPTGLAFL